MGECFGWEVKSAQKCGFFLTIATVADATEKLFIYNYLIIKENPLNSPLQRQNTSMQINLSALQRQLTGLQSMLTVLQ